MDKETKNRMIRAAQTALDFGGIMREYIEQEAEDYEIELSEDDIGVICCEALDTYGKR